MLSILFGILFSISFVTCDKVEYDLSASWFEPKYSIDGFEKKVLAFNHQIPGPLIEAHVGDELVVNVHNHFDEALSVHWHGILQQDQNEQDGVEGVTECPLAPGEKRTYHWKVEQSGTYWYHAHSSVQYGEGLYGALILRDKKDVDSFFDHDHEEVVMVADWYHHKMRKLFHWLASPESKGNEPIPDNVIINGIGQGYCHHECDYPVFKQSSYKPTLYRFINAAAFGTITVSIDDHYFVVVEIDGNPVHPKIDSIHDINEGYVHEEITHIRIDIGQRYSALVFPKQGHRSSSYWLRAQFDKTQFWKEPGNCLAQAIVSYHDYAYEPHSDESTFKTLSYVPGAHHVSPHYGYFRPVLKDTIEMPARTHTQYIDIDFHLDHEHVDKPYLDGRNCMIPHKSSYLSYVLAERHLPDTCFYLHHHHKDVVRVVFQNFDADEHPMHLHGHKFWVLHQGKPNDGPYNDNNDALNLEYPVYRDTVTVNGNSSLVVQFCTDNPGLWLFHCHNDWHMNLGLMFLLVVDKHEVVERLGYTEHLKKWEWY